MILKIPVTLTNMPEWVRRTANAVNALLTASDATEARVKALETFAALPFGVDSITLRPVALPSSPAEGMTVYDSADKKVKTWNGTAWQNHF